MNQPADPQMLGYPPPDPGPVPRRRWPWVAAIGGLVLAVALLAGWRLIGGGPDRHLDKARKALAQGDARASVIEAKNYLAQRPDSADGRFLLGRALLALGDARGASAEFQRAEKAGLGEDQLAPAVARAWLEEGRAREVAARFADKALSDPQAMAELATQVARAHRELGNPDKARQATERARLAAPGHLGAQTMELTLQADRGEVDQALAKATELASRADAPLEAHLLRADLLMRKGKDQVPAAVVEFRKAVAQQPRSVEAQSGLVSALLRQGDVAAAQTQVAEMRKALPGLPLVIYLDGLSAFLANDLVRAKEAIEQLAKQAEPTAATQTLAGMVNARLGQFTLAEGQLGAAIAEQPSSPVPRLELAGLHLKNGRPERAMEVLKPLIAGDQANVDVWVLTGQAHARLGDFKQADEAFERARRARPDDLGIRAESAKAQIALGRSEVGLRELEAVARAEVDSIDTDLTLLAAHMRAGRSSQAMQALATAERKKPGLPLLEYLRGQILHEAGDRDGARAAYESALKRDPKFVRAVGALAILDQVDAKPQEARKRFEALAKLLPQSAGVRLTLADIVLRSGGSVAEVRSLVDEAVRLDPKEAGTWRGALVVQRMLGRTSETLARAQAAVAAIPDEPSLLLELAAAQTAAGNPVQALTHYRRVTQLQPQSADAHLRLAIALGAAGNTDAARAPLERALELAPTDPGVVRVGIAMALNDKQVDRARALVKAVQTRFEKDPAGWDLEVELERQLGRSAAAAAAAQTALQKAPSTERAVVAHQALGADRAAAQAFEQRWLQGKPGDTMFLAYLADAERLAGRHAAAEAHLRHALKFEPQNPILLNNLADLLVQRNPSEALTLAQRASAVAPHLPFTWTTLAEIHAAGGRNDEAIAAQRRVIDIRPDDPGARVKLGRYLLADGKTGQAREELRRAAAEGVPEPIRRQATELLNKAGG